MTICAVIAGCKVWKDICDYCRVIEAWFREALGMGLENGIPSHDTIQRIWSMIEPKEFERCFCAWANEHQFVLGQLAVEEKSNEITAVPQLLDMLDVAGYVVTADAISCQKEIVKKISSKQADYVLSLQENQPTFCHEVGEYFEDSAENMAVVCHIALNILKNHPSKISLARKRHRCSYDDAFFADVICSVHA